MSECGHNCSSCSSENCAERTFTKDSLNEFSSVGKVIGVISGKGGVGKSLVTALLASKMQALGKRAAIMDADLTGPTIPRLFGLSERMLGSDEGLEPAVSAGGTNIVSMNLILEKPTDPVIWRGSVIAGVVRQFWTDVVWRNIDYMFIDMPPGTGDVPLTVYQSLPIDGVVIVTSPQDLVSMIVEKAVNMARLDGINVPVLGLVENMSYFECDTCKKHHYIFGKSNLEDIAARHGIEHTARIPMAPAIAAACDEGRIESLPSPWLDGIANAIQAL